MVAGRRKDVFKVRRHLSKGTNKQGGGGEWNGDTTREYWEIKLDECRKDHL